MDPNSQHQLWSRWHYRVYPAAGTSPRFSQVKLNCARFGRLLFGGASEMLLEQIAPPGGRAYWDVQIRTEGPPAHDPQYVVWMHVQWDRFFRHGFGATCDVQSAVKIEAGSRQDGKPADQVIMLPYRIGG